MYRIGKTFRFEAGHHLPSLPEGHKCKRPHGHSYQVEVVLSSKTLDVSGFVIDYAWLDPFKKWIEENLDHRDLNEVLPVATTAENIARYLADVAIRVLGIPGAPIWLESVKVKETENTFAEYIP